MKRNIFLGLLLSTGISYSADLSEEVLRHFGGAPAQRRQDIQAIKLSWLNDDETVYREQVLEPNFVKQGSSFWKLTLRVSPSILTINSWQQEMNEFLRPDYLAILQNLYFNRISYLEQECVDKLSPATGKFHYQNLVRLIKCMGLNNHGLDSNLKRLFRAHKSIFSESEKHEDSCEHSVERSDKTDGVKRFKASMIPENPVVIPNVAILEDGVGLDNIDDALGYDTQVYI